MLRDILKQFEKEDILFNIVKDENVTVVTNRRVVVTNMNGDILEEKGTERAEKIEDDIIDLMNKIKSEECVE